MKLFIFIFFITISVSSYAQDADIFKTGLTLFDVRVTFNRATETEQLRFFKALDIKIRESYDKGFLYLAGDTNNVPSLIIIIDVIRNENCYAASVLFLNNDGFYSNNMEKLVLDNHSSIAVDDEGELLYNISLVLSAILKRG